MASAAVSSPAPAPATSSSSSSHPKSGDGGEGNTVWVSVHKHLGFYADIAIRMFTQHSTVELHGLGAGHSSRQRGTISAAAQLPSVSSSPLNRPACCCCCRCLQPSPLRSRWASISSTSSEPHCRVIEQTHAAALSASHPLCSSSSSPRTCAPRVSSSGCLRHPHGHGAQLALSQQAEGGARPRPQPATARRAAHRGRGAAHQDHRGLNHGVSGSSSCSSSSGTEQHLAALSSSPAVGCCHCCSFLTYTTNCLIVGRAWPLCIATEKTKNRQSSDGGAAAYNLHFRQPAALPTCVAQGEQLQMLRHVDCLF